MLTGRRSRAGHLRTRALTTAALGLVLALAGATAPLTAAPAAAAPTDVWISASGPASSLPIGTPFDLEFTPGGVDPLASFTVHYSVPNGVQLLDTASVGDLGNRSCDVTGRTVTCVGTGADTAPWRLRLLTTEVRSVTHTFTIAGSEPDPDPDPTPNVATVVTSGTAATKDVAVVPTGQMTGTVGEPMQVGLVVTDVPTPPGDPAWVVGGLVGFQFPDSFDVVAVERIATAPPDPEASGRYFDQTQCYIVGNSVGCIVTSDLTDDIFSVTVVPTEAGPWSISGSYQTGSGQSDPAPDPRSNYAYWYVDVSPGTPHATPGTIEASLTLMGTDIPVTDAVVLAYLPTDGAFPSQANAWAKPDDSGRFTLSGLVPGRYRLLVLMPDGGPARTQWLSEARTREDASVIELLSGQTRNLGTHPLMRWTGIAGTVLVGSRPVEGAVVSAFATDATWAPLRRAVTGEDGRYDLDLPPGDYQIRVTPPAEEGWSTVWYGGTGARSSAAAVSPSEDRGRHIDLVVAPAATVTGLVSGPGGPVAGARVIFYATSDRYAGSYQTTTTSFGLYEMRDLADDVYRVRIVPPAGSGMATEWYLDASSRSTSTPLATSGRPIFGVNVTLGP